MRNRSWWRTWADICATLEPTDSVVAVPHGSAETGKRCDEPRRTETSFGHNCPVPKRVDPAERVLNLLTLLLNKSQPMSREEVAREMAHGSTPYHEEPEKQRQQFSADMKVIEKKLNIPVRRSTAVGDQAGQTLYGIIESEMCIPDVRLDEDERRVLGTALAAVRHGAPGAGEALLKFEADEHFGSIVELDVPVPLPVVRLTEAAQRGKRVTVRLGGSSVEVEPWRLVFDNGVWFVVGLFDGDTTPRAMRCLGLSGDDVVVSAQDAVHERSTLSYREMVRLLHAVGGEGSSTEIMASVLVDDHAWSLVQSEGRVVDAEPSTEGWRRVRVMVTDVARFRGWLLGLAEHAIVEGPTELREHVVRWLDDFVAVAPLEGEAPPPPADGSTRTPGPRPMAERLHRLLAIVPRLLRGRSMSVSELAKLVEADEDQLIRDLQFASNCGIPPYTADVLFQFWVEDGRIHLYGVEESNLFRRATRLINRSVRLTYRQATAVAVALAGMRALHHDDHLAPAVESLRRKLENAIGQLPVEVRLRDQSRVDEMSTAIREGRRVEIEYVDSNDRRSTRLIEPLRVFTRGDGTYVIADDVSAEPVPGRSSTARSFRLDRIIDLRITDHSFVPRDVDVPVDWDFGDGARRVALLLPPGNDWVLDRVALRSWVLHSDGSIAAWVDVASTVWLSRLLIRCGAGATTLGDPELRDSVVRVARDLRRLYEPQTQQV